MVSTAQPTDADEIIWFLLEELKLASQFEQLAPPPSRLDDKTGEVVRRREGYAPLVLNLIGLLGRYLGVVSKPDLEAVVLTDLRYRGRASKRGNHGARFPQA